MVKDNKEENGGHTRRTLYKYAPHKIPAKNINRKPEYKMISISFQ